MSSLNDRLLLAGLCSFVLALVLTPVVRKIARQRAILDLPNDRSSHAIPVPRVGGTAIVLGTVLGAFAAVQYVDWRLALLGVASLILAVMGLYDDLRPISVIQKYVPQIVATVIAVIALDPAFHVTLPFLSFNIDGIAASVVAAIWIVAFINVLNFMDGIDGLAAGSGALIAFGVLMLTSGAGAFMLLPLAGALLGFLVWNIEPSSIFMGDAGSQFVGYVLAVGVLHWPEKRVDPVAMIIIFAPLLFDTGLTLIRRLLTGKNIFQAHREHLYQRLSGLGYSHRAVANLYYLLCAMSLLVTVGYLEGTPVLKVIATVTLLAVLVAYAIGVTMLEAGRLANEWLMPSARQAPRNSGDPGLRVAGQCDEKRKEASVL
jgi:Fuc2NAc and GlcNAc transferase